MDKIESFKIDHLRLMPGLYVSRKDCNSGCTVTTFDMRITAPNREPVMDMPAIHTIEHLGATFLRNSDIRRRVYARAGYRKGAERKILARAVQPAIRARRF